MIVVNYSLLFNGRVARSEDLNVKSIVAAKRLLSQKLPKIWHIFPVGNWEDCAGSFTRRFASEVGGSYLVYLSEGYAEDQIPPLVTGECVDEDSPQLTLF